MSDIKKEIRNEISSLITDYEISDPLNAAVDWLDEFYQLLLKIENNWKKLTGE